MSFDFALYGSAFATLFVIIDPFGNLPVFMSLTSRISEKDRRKAAFVSNSIALSILLIFGFFGFQVFGALGITTEALQISGGLLLLLVALQLLTGEEEDPGRESGTINAAVVPLGTPLLAGPGSIVAFMILVDDAGKSFSSILAVSLGLISVLMISFVTMRFATPIMRVMGKSGVMLLTRLSGMLLAAIATQLIIAGVTSIVRTL
ncbi:multiple antibiotic resistance protein [Arcanobacterium pluranimalium]|uniref:MarC family protein n=1 Tax=Arcanobacterium pluranimalium TaxID=108028 RepID=UPI001956D8C6|nr:multiple antibiotic resistance protein [Arcanobacterium pluranimalium]